MLKEKSICPQITPIKQMQDEGLNQRSRIRDRQDEPVETQMPRFQREATEGKKSARS
jgi:hypothetical protein